MTGIPSLAELAPSRFETQFGKSRTGYPFRRRTQKNHELVEFALADMSHKLFVSRYQVQLPEKRDIAEFLRSVVEELGVER